MLLRVFFFLDAVETSREYALLGEFLTMGVTLGLWRSTESLMNDFDDPASVISAISVVRSSFFRRFSRF